jgi:O-antigen/teichoic acid export membrane protein
VANHSILVGQSDPTGTPEGHSERDNKKEENTGAGKILAVLTQLGLMNVVLGFGAVVRNKVMAIYLKPAGFGEFAQIASIATAVYVFVQFGMAIGLSRHAAAHREPEKRQMQLSSANFLTVGLALVSLSLLLPALLTSASNPVLRTLGVLPSFEHKAILALLLLIAPLEALRNNYQCFLQGILDIRGMSTKRSMAILISTALAIPMVASFHAAGAAAQMAFGSFFLALLLGRRCRQMGYRPLAFVWDKKTAVTLAGWGGASLICNFALNSTETLIRGRLIATAGLSANGLYQSTALLTGQVTGIILGSIGAYSLATLSETKGPALAMARMRELLRVILPVTTLSLGLVGLLSIPMLSILFSSSFSSAATFFPLQLSSNYVQAAAWITGAPILGFGLVRTWMVIQLIGAGFRYAATMVLSSFIGVHAVPAGLLLAVAFDLVANLILCRRLEIHVDAQTVRAFLLGGTAILICAMVGCSSHSILVLYFTALFLCAIVALMARREAGAVVQTAVRYYRRFTHR